MSVPSSALPIIPISSLLLDVENPRFISISPNADQETLIDELYQEHDLLPLIEDLQQDYFSFANSFAVIFNATKNKYIALEGNRRLASMKIISSLDLLNKYGLDSTRLIKPEDLRVPIFVFESREEAEIYLDRIHVRKPESWGTIAKLKFFYTAYLNANNKQETFDDNLIRNLAKKHKKEISNAFKCIIHYIVFQIIEKHDYFNIENLSYKTIEFSLLTTALGKPSIRTYVGLQHEPKKYKAHTFSQIENGINVEKLEKIVKLIYEKCTGPNGKSSIIGENRNLKHLAEIVKDEKLVDDLFITKNLDMVLKKSKILGSTSKPVSTVTSKPVSTATSKPVSTATSKPVSTVMTQEYLIDSDQIENLKTLFEQILDSKKDINTDVFSARCQNFLLEFSKVENILIK